MELAQWYLENLVCPRDRMPLSFDGVELACSENHKYPVVDGVPVMLLGEMPETLNVITRSIGGARNAQAGINQGPGWYLETLGISDDERAGILRLVEAGNNAVDPVVSYLVAATNGIMYRELLGRLKTYPIPNLPLPEGHGKSFLDLGCSWGRWCIAASKKGYSAVGLDPSLGAVMAARRVASQLGLSTRYVVGDARRLPFRNNSFDLVFSYSVIQHFSYDDARTTISEASRVLVPGGTCKTQLPNAFGIRCLFHQARRGFRKTRDFEVRYWTPSGLRNTFNELVGETTLSADCFFGLGLQASDLKMMTPMKQRIVLASEMGKRISKHVGILRNVADSIWVESINSGITKDPFV